MHNKLSLIIPNHGNYISKNFIEEVIKIQCEEIIIVGGIININFDDPRIKVVENISKSNASTNRNKGSEIARADYLLFVDKDVILDSEYINNNFIHKEIKHEVVYGIYKHFEYSNNFLEYFHNQITIKRTKDAKNFSSSHFLIKKETFKDIGKFNPFMESYEDIEFYNRLLKYNITLHFDESFYGTHLKKYTLSSAIKEIYYRFDNSLKYKSKYSKIFTTKTIDNSTKSLFINKLVIFLIAFGSIIAQLHISILLSLIFIYLIYEFNVQKKIFKINNFKFFILSFFYSIILNVILFSTLSKHLIYKLFNNVFRFMSNFNHLLKIFFKIYFKKYGPIQIIHYVTARCNLRCDHCFYKETLDKKDPGEQELKTIDKVTKDMGPILWYALAGGEVFIRKDVSSIIDIIVRNTNVKYLSIPSNGWYTDRMYSSVLDVLRKHPNLLFSIYFSIDGFPEVHDKIRGENSFKKLRASYVKLSKLKDLYPNFKTNIVTTITHQNCENSSDLISYLYKEFSPDNISINLFRYHSLSSPKLPEELIKGYDNAFNKYFEIKESFNKKSILNLKDLINKIFIVKDMIQKYIIINVAKNNKYVTPCTGGRLSYVIMEDGKIKPCEILDESYGNIFENNFSNIIGSDQANKSRKNIIKDKCKCTYECAMSTNALFSWPMTKKFILRFFKFSFSKKIV